MFLYLHKLQLNTSDQYDDCGHFKMLFLFLFQASTLVIFFLLVLFENEYSSQTVCCLCVCLLLRVGADGSMVLRLCFDSPDTFLSLIAVSVSRRDPKKTAPLTPDSSPPRDGAEAASALHRAVSISASSGKTIASRGRMWGKRDVGAEAEAGADGRRVFFFFLQMTRRGWRFLSRRYTHEEQTLSITLSVREPRQRGSMKAFSNTNQWLSKGLH